MKLLISEITGLSLIQIDILFLMCCLTFGVCIIYMIFNISYKINTYREPKQNNIDIEKIIDKYMPLIMEVLSPIDGGEKPFDSPMHRGRGGNTLASEETFIPVENQILSDVIITEEDIKHLSQFIGSVHYLHGVDRPLSHEDVEYISTVLFRTYCAERGMDVDDVRACSWQEGGMIDYTKELLSTIFEKHIA